jgi:L-seryl-tRNA(Ser) seleniumtransferase
MAEKEFRKLPSVDSILADQKIKDLLASYPHDLMVKAIRQQIDDERKAISCGKSCPMIGQIIGTIVSRIELLFEPSLKPVINASGVILHTNLGRAPMSAEAIAAMDKVSGVYSNLEYDLDCGDRGSRHIHIEQLICQLTGVEAGMVVNNNAAAVLLGLTAMAKNKEVIVSRGQAVEIGGGFRIPDVMRQSGAKLVEVGTTNCTYIADFEQAITPRTAALLRVHPSNFRVEGFTQVVRLEEMVALGNRYNLPVYDDLGSGCFIDTEHYGLAPEPTVQQSVTLGAALVFFSGDKLVGGPQAGIIAGRKAYIDKLKKHPLARALRMDKTRLAGLAATFIHYLRNEAIEKIPIWQMIAMPLTDIDIRATKWAKALGDGAVVVGGESMIGGGSLPGSTLPTKLVAIKGKGKRSKTALYLQMELRKHNPPIIGRVNEDTLFLDPRTVLPGEAEIVVKALKSIMVSMKH